MYDVYSKIYNGAFRDEEKRQFCTYKFEVSFKLCTPTKHTSTCLIFTICVFLMGHFCAAYEISDFLLQRNEKQLVYNMRLKTFQLHLFIYLLDFN